MAERGPVCIYVGAEHELGTWLKDCPSDYMWTASYEYEFVAELLRWGLFFLDEGQIALVPNPRMRYVISLERGCGRWRKNKKVRQHAHLFTITVNSDFEGSLRQCRKYGYFMTGVFRNSSPSRVLGVQHAVCGMERSRISWNSMCVTTGFCFHVLMCIITCTRVMSRTGIDVLGVETSH